MQYFDGSQIEIGHGAQAKVYKYKDDAYKVYNKDYPKEWIDGEYFIQQEICKTNLPVVHYFETSEPNIIKMNLIDGITLAERMQNEGYLGATHDIVQIHKEIHSYSDIKIPLFSSFAVKDLEHMAVETYKKEKALRYINQIEDTHTLLHLDLHFLNIMYANEKYYIIDWINARLGNPVYDYARTYIIMNEFVPELGKKYLELIFTENKIDDLAFRKALYVMALLRVKEVSNEATNKLIAELESQAFYCQ